MSRLKGTLLLVFALFLMLALVKMNLTSTGLGYSITYPFGQPFNQESLRINFWEAPQPKCSTVIDCNSVTSRLPVHSRDRQFRLANNEIKLIRDDPTCLKNICPSTSFCYLGACFCHPGYEGKECSLKREPSNPWYTKHCPNLLSTNTANMTVPLHMLGGEYSLPDHDSREGSADSSSSSSSSVRISRNKCEGSVNINQKACAYLCYSHPAYGTAVVPHSLWHAAQNAEGGLWVRQSMGRKSDQNDRATEHWEAFNSFKAVTQFLLVEGNSLGRVIEVGAGPWTQFKGILYHRPEFAESVTEFVVWEPNAKRYMQEVSSCSYRNGDKLFKWDGNGTHAFPVKVQSDGGEILAKNHFSSIPLSTTNESKSSLNKTEVTENIVQYDTVISINVIEHTQDVFKYLTGLYLSLKDNGLLIFHERYYNDHEISNGDLYHPIRIKRIILDRFLMGFDILFNNCSANYEGRIGEEGYYVIARKLNSNDFIL